MAQVGELFFTLGVKGGDKTLDTLSGMQKGIEKLSSTSLAAKAAIVGVIYAFGSLLSQAGQFGQNVSTMSSALGISTKDLQQFEQAGVKAGVAIEDMDAAITSSFNKLKTYTFTGQLPEKWDYLARMAGIDKEAWTNPATHIQETLGALQRLYNSKNPEITPLIKTGVAESFGISDLAVQQAIARGKLDPNVVSKQPFKSEGAIEQLNKLSARLKEIKAEINNTFNDWSSQHGVKLAEDFLRIEKAFLGMLTQLDGLLTKLGAFEKLGDFFLFIAEALKIATNALIRLQGGTTKDDGKTYLERYAELQNQQAIANAGSYKASVDLFFARGGKILNPSGETPLLMKAFSSIYDFFTQKGPTDEDLRQEKMMRDVGANSFGYLDRLFLSQPSMLDFLSKSLAEPPVNVGAGNQNNQQVTVNQDINFNHDGADYQRTASSMKDATVQASQAWKFNPAHVRLT